MRISVNSAKAESLISRISNCIGRPGLKQIGLKAVELLERDTLESFATSTDPETGAAWPPRKYTPGYRWGQRKGKPAKRKVKPWRLLVKTGALRRGAKARLDLYSNRAVIKGVVSGQASTYAEAHQFGSNTVPQRRYLGYRSGTTSELAAFAASLIRNPFGGR